MKKLALVACLAWVVCAGAQAQPTPAKKELVAKILQMQQPAVEAMARGLAEQPARVLMDRARNEMQTRIPPDKREAVAKEIQADVKKYADEAVPLLRERALRLAPFTIGVLLDERFTEEELKQLIAIIESPVNRKFLQLGAEMQKSLQDRLVGDAKGAIEPKIKALELAVAGHLGIPVTAPAAAPSAGARAPARAASN